jgi:hypothetical protein
VPPSAPDRHICCNGCSALSRPSFSDPEFGRQNLPVLELRIEQDTPERDARHADSVIAIMDQTRPIADDGASLGTRRCERGIGMVKLLRSVTVALVIGIKTLLAVALLGSLSTDQAV